MPFETTRPLRSMATRRQFMLSAATAAAAAPLAGCGGGDSDDTLAQTSSGTFRGQVNGDIVSHLGIPYAHAPVGALRFQAPRAARPASGIIDANAFGPASLQTVGGMVSWIYPAQDVTSEDCLTVNVWAPRGASGLPVVVWLHGGAFRTGATRMPLMNGAALAQRGVVVVTVNYRLGALGLLVHPEFQDPQNGSSANWQLQDMGAALRWVHDNIAAFGGDANRICLMGQSGGAMSAALLAQNHAYRRYIHKAVLLSPPSVTAPASMSQADSVAYTELLASRLATTPRGLRGIPAQTLHNAELTLNAETLPARFTTGKVIKLAPLVDGITCLGDWARLPWPSDLPVVINYTLDEGAFWYGLIDPAGPRVLTPPAPPTAAALAAAVTGLVGGSAATAAAAIDTYARAAASDGRSTAPADLWIDMYGDRLLRNYGTRFAATIATAGAPVRFGTYMHALPAPGRGVPHCAELPLLFGTQGLDYYKDKVGAGPAESQLSDRMMGALVSFARDSQPMLAAGQPWPLYRPGTDSSVRWGEGTSGGAVIAAVPKLQQLGVWDAMFGS
jgi:para-nitrobenzyl esterase